MFAGIAAGIIFLIIAPLVSWIYKQLSPSDKHQNDVNSSLNGCLVSIVVVFVILLIIVVFALSGK